MKQNHTITDDEERALDLLVRLKEEVLAALVLVGHAQKAGDRLDGDLAMAAELEQLALDGYRRALAFRKKHRWCLACTTKNGGCDGEIVG